MKFFCILLGLIASATAVDIRFADGCDGWYAACSNINPGICCSLAGATRFLQIVAVPSNWHIRGSGFLLENCNNFLSDADGRGNLCFGHERFFSSGRYSFVPGKLARSPGTGDITTSGECQRADTFALEDGTKYPISQLNDGEVNYLV
jgi:hypothetical protein